MRNLAMSVTGRLFLYGSVRSPAVPRNARNCGRQQTYNRKDRPNPVIAVHRLERSNAKRQPIAQA